MIILSEELNCGGLTLAYPRDWRIILLHWGSVRNEWMATSGLNYTSRRVKRVWEEKLEQEADAAAQRRARRKRGSEHSSGLGSPEFAQLVAYVRCEMEHVQVRLGSPDQATATPADLQAIRQPALKVRLSSHEQKNKHTISEAQTHHYCLFLPWKAEVHV